MQKTTQKTTKKPNQINLPVVIITPSFAIENKMIIVSEATVAVTILNRFGQKIQDRILRNESVTIKKGLNPITLIGYQAKKGPEYHKKLIKILKTEFDIYKHLLDPRLKILIETKNQKYNRISINFETAESIKHEFVKLPLEFKHLFPKQ